jgi:hypothetical protein
VNALLNKSASEFKSSKMKKLLVKSVPKRNVFKKNVKNRLRSSRRR